MSECEEVSTKPKGIASRTVWPFYGFGLLLFVCLWLPVAKGCNGKLVYPVESVRALEPDATVQDIFGGLSMLLVYGNGLLAALLLTLAAFFATRRWWWNAFRVECACTLLWVGITLFLAFRQSMDNSRQMLEFVLYPMVTFIVTLTWIAKAWLEKRPFQAWARVRYSWVLCAVFIIHMSCIFGAAQIGYYVSMAALVGMAFTIERASRWMEHDLWDPHAPVQPFQFSLWNLFIWMTFPPIAIAYFFSVDQLVSWIFD